MCTIVAYQHHSRRSVQVAGWLYIRKTKIVSLCTDGAAATTGRLSALSAQIKEVAPECQSCVIHREMLASQKMPPELNSV